MNNLFQWLKPKSRRDVLTFIGSGIAAVVVAAWAVLTYILPSAEHKPTLKVTYHLCFAPEGSESVCGPGDLVVKTKTRELEPDTIIKLGKSGMR
jgi:hypothetical protein